MKAIILNGIQKGGSLSEQIETELIKELESRGYKTEHIILRDKKIHYCTGDFFCWIKNPGICTHDDDNLLIARSVIESDLMIFLTPVTFGGYSSALKSMVDHLIQNIHPDFIRLNKETHHKKRYAEYPDFMAIGWLKETELFSEDVFHNLVYRNSLNLCPGKTQSVVLNGDMDQPGVRSSLKLGFDSLAAGSSAVTNALKEEAVRPEIDGGQTKKKVRNALLLTGSIRQGRSTSYSLGGYLLEELAKAGIETNTIHTYASLKTPEKLAELFNAVDSADLLILSFPLYVDTLPAPVTEILEKIETHRKKGNHRKNQYFISIANCGYPEAHQNTNVQAVCKIFSGSAGFVWLGGLSLGGGGMIHGQNLKTMGGQAHHIRTALETAAKALIEGNPLPEEAKTMMAKAVIPNWTYRLIGDVGWRMGAKKYGMQKSLGRRPYERVER